jgi:hypothetical protein
METPYFLVGSERSGTTMLRLMLNQHPEICFHHEFVYSVDAIKADGKFPSLDSYKDYLVFDRVFQMDNLEVKNSADYTEVVRDFLFQIKKRANKPIVGATVHRNAQYLPSIWPDCKFIHIVRDPRDVTRSYVQMGWGGHVWVSADTWLKLEKELNDFELTLPEDSFITIKYEDIVQNPQRVLSTICEFIGVKYHENMMNYSDNSSYSTPDTSLLNQWKHKATKYEIALIEYKLQDMMLKYGYELSGYELPNVNAFTNLRLNTIARINRFFFSLRKYGYVLKTLDIVSRRLLPIKRFRTWVKKKMDAITNKSLK